MQLLSLVGRGLILTHAYHHGLGEPSAVLALPLVSAGQSLHHTRPGQPWAALISQTCVLGVLGSGSVWTSPVAGFSFSNVIRAMAWPGEWHQHREGCGMPLHWSPA